MRRLAPAAIWNLMELRVRFDTENNLAWAKMLEQSGSQVIYGAKASNATVPTAVRAVKLSIN